MFLDKPIMDRNAVQTVSRLNRCHEGKKDVVVVDFTNNAKAILKAFAKYRKGMPFEPEEPDPELCLKMHIEILATGVFSQKDAWIDYSKGALLFVMVPDDPESGIVLCV
jgi:type I restriction enzyme R subunit